MRKEIFVIVFSVLSILGCSNKPTSSQNLLNISVEELDSKEEPNSTPQYLEQMILSSNFPYWNDISLSRIHSEIDSKRGCFIMCRVYYEKEVSETDTPNSMTLGWVAYDFQCRKMYNISANLKHPQELIYNKEIEKKLLKQIKIDSLKEIPPCSKDRFTKLPFNWSNWNNWYKKQEHDKLPKEGDFNYYKVSDNVILDQILTLNPLHDGFVSYLYFVLDEKDNYKALLLFSRFDDPDYNMIRDKFYDIITIKNDSIISSLQVGFLADINEDGSSFNIDKDLTIKVYDERMAHESYGAVPIDTLNISTYQIQNDGMIKKTE